MRALVLTITVLSTVLTTPAFAQEATPAASTTVKPVKPVKPKKICRREEITGSIMATSVCHLAPEWESIDQQNAKAAEHLRSNRGGSTTGN